MTKHDQRQLEQAEKDRQHMLDFCEQPGATPPTTRPRLEHPAERRRPGFPATFGPLARATQWQAEAANEARARLLRPPGDRLARDASRSEPPFKPTPREVWAWVVDVLLGVFVVVAIVVLAWAFLPLFVGRP